MLVLAYGFALSITAVDVKMFMSTTKRIRTLIFDMGTRDGFTEVAQLILDVKFLCVKNVDGRHKCPKPL